MRITLRLFAVTFFTVLALVFMLDPPASAQTYQFTNGGGDSNWDTAANWLLVGSDTPINAVPNSRTADALINDAQVNKVDGAINLRSLTMGLGAGVNVYGGCNVAADLIHGGKLYLRPDTQGNAGDFYTNGAMELQNVAFQCLGNQPCGILPFPGSTLTVDASSTITGKLGLIGGYGNSTLINYGVITSDLSGAADTRFFIYPTLSRNYNTIQTAPGTALIFYLNEHHNMDYGVVNASGYLGYIATQFTNHALGSITAGGRVEVYAGSQFNNYGGLAAQQLYVGSDSQVSNYGDGRIQIGNGLLDVAGQMAAGQLTLTHSDLRINDGASLKLLATGSTPATAPLNVNHLLLNGGTITGGTLNAVNIVGTAPTRLIGAVLNGTVDGSTTDTGISLIGSSLVGGSITLKSGAQSGADLNIAGQGQDACILDNMTVQGIAGPTGIGYRVLVAPNSELTIGSGTKVSGAVQQIGFIYAPDGGNSVVTNDGVIDLTQIQTFIAPGELTNNGTIRASAGASLYFGYYYSPDHHYLFTNSPTGAIKAEGNGGMVIVDGIFNNQGSISAVNCNIQTLLDSVVDLGNVSISNGEVYAANNSTVNVTQGIPNSYLELHDFATGNVTGGQANFVRAYDNSILSVSAGQVGYLESFGSATLNMSGGKSNVLYSLDHSTINVSGGQVGALYTESTINVYGKNLTKTVTYRSPFETDYTMNGTLADGTVWKNKFGAEYPGGHINIAAIQSIVGIPVNVAIAKVKSLMRDGNNVRTQITVTNLGPTTAQNVTLTAARLGNQVTATTPLPSAAALASGASATWNLVFPAPVAGTHTVLSLTGTYKGGKFGGSYRLTVP